MRSHNLTFQLAFSAQNSDKKVIQIINERYREYIQIKYFARIQLLVINNAYFNILFIEIVATLYFWWRKLSTALSIRHLK